MVYSLLENSAHVIVSVPLEDIFEMGASTADSIFYELILS